MSLKATFPQLREIERTHGSLIAGMLVQRRRAAVAVSGDGRLPMFMALRDGLEQLVDRLAASLRSVEVRCRSGVDAVTRSASAYTLHLSGGGAIRADAVILTTPAYVTAELIERLAPDAAGLLRQIPYASTATISLGYRDRDLPPLAGHGFVVARGEGYRITACTWASAKWPGRAPEGFGLLRAYVGSAGDPEALERSDEEILGVVRADLAAAMGVSAQPVLARVVRWPRSMPQYTLGHVDRLAAIDRVLARFPSIVLSGAGYRGIGLPDCIRQGLGAAASLLT